MMKPRFTALFILTLILMVPIKYCWGGNNPPTTVLSKTPSLPNGKNNWYITPVNITLAATDLESGIATINYRIDSGNWVVVPKTNTLNLAPNPSLETTYAGSSINTLSWEAGTQDGQTTYTRDPVYPQFDLTSIKINSTGADWHSINHSASYAVAAPFSNMTAEVWLKTAGATNGAYFKVIAVLQDAYGNITYNQITQSSALTGTNDWTKVNTSFILSDATAIGVYLEIGLMGSGTLNIDGISINNSVKSADTTFPVSSDGNHTVEYYSTDKAGNIEITKSTSFKIDQTPPTNWRDPSAFRGLLGPSDHHLYVTVKVDDLTSGLSTFTDKYQYHTPNNTGFGVFQDLMKCSSTWLPNQWAILISPPFLPGVHTATLLTPKTDYCNSNWKICKTVRFYAEDLAGNASQKDLCINGPWIKLRGGGLAGSATNIDMLSEAAEDNTDSVIEIGGTGVNFFTSTQDWLVTNNLASNQYLYNDLLAMVPTPSSRTGALPTTTGIYRYSGNLTLSSTTVPSNYNTAVFRQIIFVDGNLRLDRNLIISNSSAVLFLVSGDVEIKKTVGEVDAAIFSDGNFKTAYDTEEGDQTSTLLLKGVFKANRFIFQRTLQGADNEEDPSEDFTFEPRFGDMLRDYLGKNAVRWLETE